MTLSLDRQEWRLETPMGDIRVRLALEEDLTLVMALLLEVSQWLQSRGIHQWPAGRFEERSISESIRRGETYLAWHEEVTVGTLALLDSDSDIWGDLPGEALYLHRLAVSRSAKGLGAHLLAWAESTTLAAGKTFLRLDCWAENRDLRAYYERAGFVFRGEAQELDGKGIYRDGWRAARYEKRVR